MAQFCWSSDLFWLNLAQPTSLSHLVPPNMPKLLMGSSGLKTSTMSCRPTPDRCMRHPVLPPVCCAMCLSCRYIMGLSHQRPCYHPL